MHSFLHLHQHRNSRVQPFFTLICGLNRDCRKLWTSCQNFNEAKARGKSETKLDGYFEVSSELFLLEALNSEQFWFSKVF